ncbi:S8 family serine peptidase [Myroides sp. BIT-d1]|uniref:S8 family serine peptidase n=1 Tax=Myroides albus TaxID=2562892 RepID=A0A6I3LLN1_9FLAO|nr:S8 family serine peptidase [Myroides albus]MTG99263.1 S8 family serine peptidase [Myroides albus]
MGKSHLKFISRKQLSEIQSFKYNYGFDSEKDEKDLEDKNYNRLATSFKSYLNRLGKDLEQKSKEKDKSLDVPYDIDYVLFTFQNQFVISDYFEYYYSNLGLEGTAFYDFSRKGLFAIVDWDKFQGFLSDVYNFVKYELEENHELEYARYITYISEFKLLRSHDILKFNLDEIGGIVYLSLMDFSLEQNLMQEILDSLIKYLKEEEIIYLYDDLIDRIELKNISAEQVQKIVRNFDIVESVTCSAFTTVKPGEFRTVKRERGFTIANIDEDLPLVGVIDTGISVDTVLAPLIINDRSFKLAGVGDPLIDRAGRQGIGHGTAVAGLVALGKLNHKNNFSGEVLADAKLLSIKISDQGNGYISEVEVLRMLYDVKEKYPAIRLFTLTTCYGISKTTNEGFSNYTYSLDKFAYETDSLIFISTGNNNNCINENTNYDLTYFNHEHTNLSIPSDSLNNVTVGAAADNLQDGAFMGIASGREFPTLYTRKGYNDLSLLYGRQKNNKHYFKPDVIESGGDIGFYDEVTLDWMDEPALILLTARPELGMMKEVGTSFSTPLVTNLAAKIIKKYPALTNESVKALIINGASLDMIKVPSNVEKLKTRIVGNGFVDITKSLFSNENSVTLILEDSIENEKIKIYPLNFPEYLVKDNLGKKNGVLKVTATLCFKFLPIKNNHLSYNPIHMAFSFFKNQKAEDIMTSESKIKSKLAGLSWSQNGRYVSKPIPYSNTQKISFNINIKDLVNEDKTFKLAIHAKLTKQLLGGIPENYPSVFPFSIVLSIEETIKDNTGKLYEEIQLINNVEILQDIILDTSLEADAELDI